MQRGPCVNANTISYGFSLCYIGIFVAPCECGLIQYTNTIHYKNRTQYRNFKPLATFKNSISLGFYDCFMTECGPSLGMIKTGKENFFEAWKNEALCQSEDRYICP